MICMCYLNEHLIKSYSFEFIISDNPHHCCSVVHDGTDELIPCIIWLFLLFAWWISVSQNRFSRQIFSWQSCFRGVTMLLYQLCRTCTGVTSLTLWISACFREWLCLASKQKTHFHYVCSEAWWKRPSTGVNILNIIVTIYKHTLRRIMVHTSFPKRPLFLSARKWSQLWRAKNSLQCVGLVPKHTHAHTHTQMYIHTHTLVHCSWSALPLSPDWLRCPEWQRTGNRDWLPGFNRQVSRVHMHGSAVSVWALEREEEERRREEEEEERKRKRRQVQGAKNQRRRRGRDWGV